MKRQKELVNSFFKSHKMHFEDVNIQERIKLMKKKNGRRLK